MARRGTSVCFAILVKGAAFVEAAEAHGPAPATQHNSSEAGMPLMQTPNASAWILAAGSYDNSPVVSVSPPTGAVPLVNAAVQPPTTTTTTSTSRPTEPAGQAQQFKPKASSRTIVSTSATTTSQATSHTTIDTISSLATHTTATTAQSHTPTIGNHEPLDRYERNASWSGLPPTHAASDSEPAPPITATAPSQTFAYDGDDAAHPVASIDHAAPMANYDTPAAFHPEPLLPPLHPGQDAASLDEKTTQADLDDNQLPAVARQRTARNGQVEGSRSSVVKAWDTGASAWPTSSDTTAEHGLTDDFPPELIDEGAHEDSDDTLLDKELFNMAASAAQGAYNVAEQVSGDQDAQHLVQALASNMAAEDDKTPTGKPPHKSSQRLSARRRMPRQHSTADHSHAIRSTTWEPESEDPGDDYEADEDAVQPEGKHSSVLPLAICCLSAVLLSMCGFGAFMIRRRLKKTQTLVVFDGEHQVALMSEGTPLQDMPPRRYEELH
eukprot:TRINITY_DN25258_c0_g1_i1.p1 TRINITY_DN25258_c0_g1~~TRINITY_DN25258_c0_g1_i1.p1  ORF type:complete len:496 (-),score=64.87 TRINITY_DN25258_c0_g1_i1:549-2036(-)